MSRRIVFALIAMIAIGCGLLGVQAYAAQEWQTAARFFGLGTLLFAGVSLAEALRNRNRTNA